MLKNKNHARLPLYKIPQSMKKPWKFPFILFNILFAVAVLSWMATHVFAPGDVHMELSSDLSEAQPGERVELRFKINDADGEVLTQFERVHEKIMHLIVVKKDLTEFQRLYPDLDEETGEFSVDLSFSEEGSYMIYADFTPKYSPKMVLHTEVEIGENGAAKTQTLEADLMEPFTVEEFTLSPVFPEKMETGKEMHFGFEVEQDGKKVELEDYLGAKGHAVILRNESLDYLHVRSSEEDLSFDAIFEQPGLYQSFVQFQVDGKRYNFDFAFEVPGMDDFYLSLELSTEELSEDTNSQKETLTIDGNDLVYSWTYEGYHPDADFEREKKESMELTDEQQQDLSLLIRENGLMAANEESSTETEPWLGFDLKWEARMNEQSSSGQLLGEPMEWEEWTASGREAGPKHESLFAAEQIFAYVKTLLELGD